MAISDQCFAVFENLRPGRDTTGNPTIRVRDARSRIRYLADRICLRPDRQPALGNVRTGCQRRASDRFADRAELSRNAAFQPAILETRKVSINKFRRTTAVKKLQFSDGLVDLF